MANAAGEGGFTPYGGVGQAEDAVLRVVADASGRTLYIEIEDDVWQAEAKSWVHADHLELWFSPERVTYKSINFDPELSLPVWQIGVPLFEREPIRAHQAEDKRLPTVSRAPLEGQTARIRIELPEKWVESLFKTANGSDSISVIYIDINQDQQKRLTSISMVIFGRDEALDRRSQETYPRSEANNELKVAHKITKEPFYVH